MNIEQIDRLELLGGVYRIPKVQEVLSKYISKIELGQHLNGDESMSFGAAFFAANRTKLFRVRPINFYDGNDFETQMIIKNSLPEA